MAGQPIEKIACSSYSSSRRRVRQSVVHSWQQILSACSATPAAQQVQDDDDSDSEGRTHQPEESRPSTASDNELPFDEGSTNAGFEIGNDLPDEGRTYIDGSWISESDSDPEVDNINDDTPIGTKIAEFAVRHNITHRALAELLAILRVYHPGLPVDPRTLLQTPQNYAVRVCAQQQGHYYHFGISCGLQAIDESCVLPTELRLQFNFDGLPLFKSSLCELWPILCLIRGLRVEPFVVGLYCGAKKPQNLTEYLQDFVSDIKDLLDHGITIREHHFVVKIDCFVCDAPARAFIKNVKSFSGYYGCDKCTEEGDYIENRMTFPKCNAPLRTDEQFDSSFNEEHHRGPTPLAALGFGLVTGFVLDYMHLVCLGVMRKLLLFWLRGPLRRGDSCAGRLPASVVDMVSAKLIALAKFAPREFARKPRSLSEVDRWKATEFRAFLLYFGPVVLSKVLPDAVYSHFMLLSSGVALLASPQFCMKFNDYANQLLRSFVEQAKHLYGPEFIVYNVHALIHLSADVKRFGPLDAFSAFPFENELRSLKRLVRKASTPLSQIIRRVSERRRFTLRASSHLSQTCSVYAEHKRGPIPDGYELSQQFTQLRKSGMFLSLSDADNCIALSGIGPALVRNILKLNGETALVCNVYKKTCDLFHYPFPSSSVGIVLATHLYADYKVVSADSNFRKCVRLPLDTNSVSVRSSQFAVIPLMHTST